MCWLDFKCHVQNLVLSNSKVIYFYLLFASSYSFTSGFHPWMPLRVCVSLTTPLPSWQWEARKSGNAPEGLRITDYSLTLLAMRGQEIRQVHVTHSFVSKTYGKKSCETVISSVWNNILSNVLGRSGNAASISRKL